MREHRLALATVVATFVLLVVGGLVHTTASSLACPDWPLCNGQVFPPMVGGVLFEHGHRLVALTVGVLTVALAVSVWRKRRDVGSRALALLALALVMAQASLGAVAVLRHLPFYASAAHLTTSVAFFITVIVIAFRLRPPTAPEVRPALLPRRGLTGAALIAVYAKLVVGAFVRHSGAGLACNLGIPLCDGQLWPSAGPAQLHMVHRFLGLAVALLVVVASVAPIRAARTAGDRSLGRVAWAGPILVLCQVALGFLTVMSGISVPIVTAHLAVGTLLIADVLTLFLLLGSRRVRPSTVGAQPAGLAPAAG